MYVGMFEDDIFAEIIFDDLRNVGVDGFVVGNAGSRSVGQRHAAVAVNVHQAGNAHMPNQDESNADLKVVIDPAIDHVDATQAVRREPHMAIAVGNHEIGTLNQFHSHFLGEKAMFEAAVLL